MRRKWLAYAITALFTSVSQAQCAMCRAVLESEDSGGVAQGINDGIIYLMIIPYVLVFATGYFVYRRMRKAA